MKNNILAIFLTIGCMALSFSSFSQSKAEIKEWKKKLKNLEPMQYKAMVEEKQALEAKVQDAQADVQHYKNESESKDAEIADLKQKLEEAQSAPQDVAAGENTGATPVSGGAAVPSDRNSETYQGLVYKVQIGAFRNKDLSKYLENHKNFSGEVGSDGTVKYTLGVFKDYWEANNFKKYLREMGVKDAWIVSYKDGKRVPIKDALEGVL